MPALIRKFHKASINNKKTVEVWGSGVAEREFLHVNDLASAIIFCINKKLKRSFFNVGGADSITIKQLCKLIRKITKFKGKIIYNTNYQMVSLREGCQIIFLIHMGGKQK